MKLYYNPFSSNARKAVMTAKLLDLPVELVLVDLARGEQRKPEFLAINPNAKVPALVDGDLSLWESGAIMTYMADRKPGNTLYPVDTARRAEVNRWLFWSAAHWTPAIGTLNWEHFLKKLFGAGEPDAATVARTNKQIEDLAAVLDAHLAKHTWLAGECVTLADVSIACPLMTTVPSKLPVTQFNHLQRWFRDVQTLEAWKATEPPARG